MNRRDFLVSSLVSLGEFWRSNPAAFAAEAPRTDPMSALKQSWTSSLPWGQVVDVTRMPGESLEEKLSNAQAWLVMKGGGVAYFPAGTYRFRETILLEDGVILRGADPGPVTSALKENYSPPTHFEFPRYEFLAEGEGMPILQAFKGIRLRLPGKASNVGVVNISLNRAHIHFDDDGTERHSCGSNRFVYGCVLRHAAVADAAVPSLKLEQKAWQRFTARHHAAIDVKSEKNLIIASNRLPRSGEENFTMNGYVLLDNKRKAIAIDGVVFDYDNRPGIYANHYSVGGPGGMGPDGTPDTHPYGFRTGMIIADNFIFNTGRMGIGFAGDGVRCLNNVIRIPDNIWRPTATGLQITTGASTNDNRAVEMRGWRWHLESNDYEVHRNWAYDRKYKINDGEGLMHEDHANSTIRDSVLRGNRGNTYLSLYKTGGIDGLLIEENEIRLGDGRQTIASGAAIYVNADRNKGRFPLQRVRIVKNTVSGGGILLSGDPSRENVIRGNRAVGGPLPLTLQANAEIADNEGFDLKNR